MALHLSLDERRIVAGLLHHRKVIVVQIAVQPRRDRLTIHREIQRNVWRDREVPIPTGYWNMDAHNFAASRWSRQHKLGCIGRADLRHSLV